MSRRTNERFALDGSPWLSRVSQFGRPSGIKSIQTGSITIADLTSSNTATITSVDLNNSIIIHGGRNTGSTNTFVNQECRVALTNATTVTVSRSGSSAVNVVGYTVIEFYPGVIRSVQRGTITINSTNTSATATITAVDTTKSVVFWLGSDASSNGSLTAAYLTLTNSTTVTSTRNTQDGSSTSVTGYQVVQFY